jgi:hypothetical protein
MWTGRYERRAQGGWRFLLILVLVAGACQRQPEAAAPGSSVPPAAAEGPYEIEWVSAEVPPSLKVGTETEIRVSFRNASQRPLPDPYLAISYHWMDAADPERIIVWDGLRTAVKRPLQPGETFTTLVKVAPPDRPGNYLLNLDLVREAVAWFSKKGAPLSSHPVSVEP